MDDSQDHPGFKAPRSKKRGLGHVQYISGRVGVRLRGASRKRDPWDARKHISLLNHPVLLAGNMLTPMPGADNDFMVLDLEWRGQNFEKASCH